MTIGEAYDTGRFKDSFRRVVIEDKTIDSLEGIEKFDKKYQIFFSNCKFTMKEATLTFPKVDRLYFTKGSATPETLYIVSERLRDFELYNNKYTKHINLSSITRTAKWSSYNMNLKRSVVESLEIVKNTGDRNFKIELDGNNSITSINIPKTGFINTVFTHDGKTYDKSNYAEILIQNAAKTNKELVGALDAWNSGLFNFTN